MSISNVWPQLVTETCSWNNARVAPRFIHRVRAREKRANSKCATANSLRLLLSGGVYLRSAPERPSKYLHSAALPRARLWLRRSILKQSRLAQLVHLVSSVSIMFNKLNRVDGFRSRRLHFTCAFQRRNLFLLTPLEIRRSKQCAHARERHTRTLCFFAHVRTN